ncbi:MAG TPA: hydrolase [Methylomirabilota bacterium]|nr:hydrolase [Methylomirabilota bacterium]
MSQPPRPAESPSHPMALDRARSALVIVDVQERLFPVMDADHREEVVHHIKLLATAAGRLGIPIVLTEQYPKGLGHTLQELRETLGAGVEPIEKVSFSCCGVEPFVARLGATGARQVVLAGIEAHVCVLLSALDLLAQGYAVHVAADAVTSRTQGNWRLAMEQLRQAGAVVTPTETVLFQWLRQAGTDDFRELSRLIR